MSIPIKGIYKPVGFSEFSTDTGTFGWGPTIPLEYFALQPSQDLGATKLQYNVTYSDGSTSGFVNAGSKVGKSGKKITAMAFRIVGPQANQFDVDVAITTSDGPYAAEAGDHMNSFGDNSSLGFFKMSLTPKALKEAYKQMSEETKRAEQDQEIAKVAEERKAKQAPITAIVLAGVGFAIGFVKGGPNGAYVGAVVGYAVGAALEKGVLEIRDFVQNPIGVTKNMNFVAAREHIAREIKNAERYLTDHNPFRDTFVPTRPEDIFPTKPEDIIPGIPSPGTIFGL